MNPIIFKEPHKHIKMVIYSLRIKDNKGKHMFKIILLKLNHSKKQSTNSNKVFITLNNGVMKRNQNLQQKVSIQSQYKMKMFRAKKIRLKTTQLAITKRINYNM